MKRYFLITGIISLLVPGVCFNVHAQEIMDDAGKESLLFMEIPIVITAGRIEQSQIHAPSTIDVITAKEIKLSGARNLGELLERLPGIQVSTAHNGLEMLMIRGVGGRYNDKTLLMIDGFPYRTLYYSNHPVNEQIPLEDIKRIEVIRGPGSVLYGTNAFAGVINIITKDADDIKESVLSVSYGSWESQEYSILTGKKTEKGGITVLGRVINRTGWKIEKDENGLDSGKENFRENTALVVKGSYADLTFSFRHSEMVQPDITESIYTKKDNHRDHSLINLGYQLNITEKIKLLLKGYYNHFNLYYWDYDFESDGSLNKLKKSEKFGRIMGSEMQMNYHVSDTHVIVGGATFEYEKLARGFSKKWEGTDPPYLSGWVENKTGRQAPIESGILGIFAEDTVRLFERLNLTLGLRYDYYTGGITLKHDSAVHGYHVSKTAGISYELVDKTVVKVLYGEAFRHPSYREMYKKSDDAENEGNINLDSEDIQTFETSLEYRKSRYCSFRVNYFYNRFKNYISTIGDGNYQNNPQKIVRGAEIDLRGFLLEWFSWFANYAYIDGREKDGSRMPSIARDTVNAGVTYSGMKYILLHTWAKYVSRRSRPSNYQEDLDDALKKDNLGKYTTLNCNVIMKEILDPLELSVSIYNILDRQYYYSGEKTDRYDVEEPGRRITATLTYKF